MILTCSKSSEITVFELREKNVIFETKGTSMIKDFELGYQDVMRLFHSKIYKILNLKK